jgi:hypothetical protein
MFLVKLVSILIVFVGASVLTPGWVYVGVSGFTLRLWFSRNICFHSWLFFNVASFLTPENTQRSETRSSYKTHPGVKTDAPAKHTQE